MWLQETGLFTLRAIIALGVIWAFLRLLDSVHGISFGEHVWPELKAGNQAVSDYYRTRFGFCCMVVAVLYFWPS